MPKRRIAFPRSVGFCVERATALVLASNDWRTCRALARPRSRGSSAARHRVPQLIEFLPSRPSLAGACRWESARTITHCIWQSRPQFELGSLHRPAAVSGLSFQWPHDDRGDWADDYPELPVDPPVPAQSAKQTEIAPPTGLVEGEADLIDGQAKLPDWMFDAVGRDRP